MRIVFAGTGEMTERWAAYVGVRAPWVTDLLAWRRVVMEAYGIQSHLLAAMDGERIVGTLALFEIRHPIFGHYLATAVFGNDGGLYFDDAVARDALVAEARALAVRLGVAYLLIRTRELSLAGFQIDDHYRAAALDLEGGADAVWKRLPSKTRNQVRRGMTEGFTLATGLDQRDAFFGVFHAHMRALGTPAHSHAFYESVVRNLTDKADFLVVRDGDAHKSLVAGALLFWSNGTATNYHTVALRKYNPRCPNYLLYWTMIQASCGRGCSQFDMGRSEVGSTNLDFKLNWGTRPVSLTYNYFLVKSKSVPYLDPRNPKYRVAIAAWRRLPLAVTKVLGAHLIRGLA